jgi:hypothetical protein
MRFADREVEGNEHDADQEKTTPTHFPPKETRDWCPLKNQSRALVRT